MVCPPLIDKKSMSKLHICNTNFEWELVQKKAASPVFAFERHPIFLQLQFLPLLYAEPEDGVVVTDSPNEEFWEALQNFGIIAPKLHFFSDKDFSRYRQIESWGPSLILSRFAQEHHLQYSIPPWETVLQVNSKAFSYQISPKLPGSTLLFDQKQAQEWLNSSSGKVVFKTCYGVSGRGHLLIDLDEYISQKRFWSFLQKEWNENRPVIAEPWVSRVLDFSTQWEIVTKDDIRFIGAAICENDPKGSYRRNYAGDPVQLFGKYINFLEEHRKIVLPILTEMARLKHIGNVGIDAMVFLEKGELLLHPVVEINARKTMGWTAIRIQKLRYSEKIISLQFTTLNDKLPSLLPNAIFREDKSVLKFAKHLYIEVQEGPLYN
jgi:hypothetical protein